MTWEAFLALYMGAIIVVCCISGLMWAAGEVKKEPDCSAKALKAQK